MKRPRGTTLLEMLAVLTVGGVLMGLAFGALLLVVRLETAARERGHATDALVQLVGEFRRDAHEALAAAPGQGEPKSVVLRQPQGRKVIYRLAPGKIVRSEEGGPAAGREDWFRLPPGCDAAFAVRPGHGADVASLVIDAPEGAGPALRVEAAVARDHRLAKPNE
jgi:prepilin-type N-terminal cleavage/methylation domain-containing protein